jgi:hypothetical protein
LTADPKRPAEAQKLIESRTNQCAINEHNDEPSGRHRPRHGLLKRRSAEHSVHADARPYRPVVVRNVQGSPGLDAFLPLLVAKTAYRGGYAMPRGSSGRGIFVAHWALSTSRRD